MRLWLLKPRDKDNPIFDQYDTAQRFVIEAHTAREARAIAAKNGGDEKNAWLDSRLTRCLALKPGKVSGVVCRDFNAG